MLMKKHLKRKLAVSLSVSLMLANAGAWSDFNQSVRHVSAAGESSQAMGVNVQYHTQEEIREYMQASGVTLNDALTFAVDPVTEAPYELGALSDETLESALAMLNQIRYIAGLDDDVQLSDDYTELVQAAALANYANNQLSHSPVQPVGMSDELYTKASKGASSSNIAWASWANCSINATLVNSWMEDGDEYNIDCVGHRRWILNPSMKRTGFGAVSGSNGTYSAIYAHDGAFGNTDKYGVMWPAQNMPVEYFGKVFPWSISMGYQVDESQVQVKLTRESDGKVWNFSQASADGEFYVNNDNYGQKGCIIFRPDSGTLDGYQAGDVFRVEITGLREEVSYTVHFFAVTPETTTAPTKKPTPTPTAEASTEPTEKPTPTPTAEASTEPTEKPTPTPTAKASIEPTEKPTPTPTAKASIEPTEKPTPTPTAEASTESTKKPTPTAKASAEPANKQTSIPTPTDPKVEQTGVSSGNADVDITIPEGIKKLEKIKKRSRGFTVTWKKTAKAITGYQIQYSTNKRFKGKTTKIRTIANSSTTRLTVRKLKAKKKYYVRIRTYRSIGGKRYYSVWSKSRQIKTKK